MLLPRSTSLFMCILYPCVRVYIKTPRSAAPGTACGDAQSHPSCPRQSSLELLIPIEASSLRSTGLPLFFFSKKGRSLKREKKFPWLSAGVSTSL